MVMMDPESTHPSISVLSTDAPTTTSLKRRRADDDGGESTAAVPSSSPSATSSPVLPPPFVPETPPRGPKRLRVVTVRDPQPNPAYLLAVYGIKHRDFAYESTLPPVPAYRPQQLLDHDSDGEGDADGAIANGRWQFGAPSASPSYSYENSQTGGYSQSQGSQRRRLLEREATEPAMDDPSSQPPPRGIVPSRALGPGRKLLGDYNSPFDDPASQQSQPHQTPPRRARRTLSTSSPGGLAAPTRFRPQDDEVPFATPGNSPLWPPGGAHAGAVPGGRPADAAERPPHAPSDDVLFAELGLSRPYGSPLRDLPSSPRTPPPARRMDPLDIPRPPRTPPYAPLIAMLLAPPGASRTPGAQGPAPKAPRAPPAPAPAPQNGTPAARPPPPGPTQSETPAARPRGGAPAAGARAPRTPRATSPGERPPRAPRTHARTASATDAPAPGSAPASPARAEGARTYNLRKRPASPGPPAAPAAPPPNGRRVRSAPPDRRAPPQAAAPPPPKRARTPRAAPPPAAAAAAGASQPKARSPQAAPRGAFTARSAHSPAEGAASKAGRPIREKGRERSKEAQQANPPAAAGTQRTLRARRAG